MAAWLLLLLSVTVRRPALRLKQSFLLPLPSLRESKW
jgi:hypothetical protein